MLVVFLAACGSKTASSNNSSNVNNTATAPNSTTKSTDDSALPPLPDSIKKKGKLVVGIRTDFPPFGTVDASGKNIGYDIDIARQLASYAFGDASAVEFVQVTSSNRIPFLNSNKVDLLLASMAVTDERKQTVDFTDPYFSSSNLLLVKNDSNITSLDDLQGKTVITLTGSAESIALQKLEPSAKQLQLTTTSEELQALKDGRGVAIAKDESVLYGIVAKDSSVKIVGKPFETMAIAGAVRKGETQYLNWVNAAIKQMKTKDLFYQWFKQWFPEYKNIPELLPRSK